MLYKKFTSYINGRYIEGQVASPGLAALSVAVLTVFLLLELFIAFPVLFIAVSIARIISAALHTFTCLVYDIKYALLQYYHDMRAVKNIATKPPNTKDKNLANRDEV